MVASLSSVGFAAVAVEWYIKLFLVGGRQEKGEFLSGQQLFSGWVPPPLPLAAKWSSCLRSARARRARTFFLEVLG